MPSRRLKSTGAQAVTPILLGAAVLVLIGLTLWGIAHWVSSRSGQTGRIEVRLGDDVFNVGSAKKRADEIAQRGPTLWPGLLAKDQGYVILNHLGPDPLTGWHAFAAVPAGSPVSCAVQWQEARLLFVDPCTGTAFPGDGRGLTPYDVSINAKREVIIDLTPGGDPGRPATTAGAPGGSSGPTSSTIRITGTPTTVAPPTATSGAGGAPPSPAASATTG